jgi:hypothetical protein
MSKDEEQRNSKLDELTRLLDELKLNQTNNNNTINTAQSLINELRDNSKKEPAKNSKKKRGSKPEVGDRVVIVNPNRNQPKEGTVIGYTLAGFVKVRGDNGHIVRRIPINLIIQE